MSKAGKKLLSAMKQAVAFARGDCDHEWIDEDCRDGRRRHCPKCGVTLYEPLQ